MSTDRTARLACVVRTITCRSAAVALWLAAGCASRDIVAAAGEPAAYCATGAPVILRSAPPPGAERARAAVCTGSVAVRAFSHAL